MVVDLKDKVVVITGSSRGIGKELIKKFARENAKVVINYFNSFNEAKELYREISKYNPNCILVKCDVTKESEVIKLYNKTIDRFGHVDVLINNAGICRDNALRIMSGSQWKEVIDVNLNSLFYCCKIFAEGMIEQKSGKIINIASLKGQIGNEYQVNYSASKAAIIGFTKSLSKELGKYNISVNAVCPGFIPSDINKTNIQKKQIAKKMSVLDIKNNLNDLSNFILYMSSNKILSVTGQVFNVDSRVV